MDLILFICFKFCLNATMSYRITLDILIVYLNGVSAVVLLMVLLGLNSPMKFWLKNSFRAGIYLGFEKEVVKLLGDVIVGIKAIRKDNSKKAHRANLTLPKDCVALPVTSVELMAFDNFFGRDESMDSVVC
ncbi:hypothetical protein HPB48_026040 [Haemaphysalis longicornis]|uniref:Uncharacterized protein n=1 Tax=Haemaphysalis longicornis TaxID=44386 RepID=A0A9J6HBC9_HAELO|nr:hypothetical protein HPB48_026040 [Haemaphysalis longicornis]